MGVVVYIEGLVLDSFRNFNSFLKCRITSNKSNTRKNVSSGLINMRNGLKNEAQPRFLIGFKVFGYLMKHPLECLIELLKLII